MEEETNQTTDPVVAAQSQAYIQQRSRLLQLPQELVDEIYFWVLGSTRMTFGVRAYMNERQPYPLALLSTCRRINQEVRSTWPNLVSFHFQTGDSMIKFLNALPATQARAIRHVQVGNMSMQTVRANVSFRVGMKLVSNLQLDRLEILNFGGIINTVGAPVALHDYRTLDNLIICGSGWNELHYITPNSLHIAFRNSDMYQFREGPVTRRPQPATWLSALHSRDGPDCGASVTIYRSKTAKPGSILKRPEYEVFEQVVSQENLQDYGKVEESSPTCTRRRGKGSSCHCKTRTRRMNDNGRRRASYLLYARDY